MKINEQKDVFFLRNKSKKYKPASGATVDVFSWSVRSVGTHRTDRHPNNRVTENCGLVWRSPRSKATYQVNTTAMTTEGSGRGEA